MEKVKVLILGLGNFGYSWATSVLPACGDFARLVGVVDRREERWKGMEGGVPGFRELEPALNETRPELVINVTPPSAHSEINEFLLHRKIAVLCEKPIADTWENARKAGRVLKEEKGFLMIGENYRYHPVFREARRLLESGLPGRIHSLSCHFRHDHPDYSMFYHGTLPHPLLEDVSIHHLDLARYLSKEEPLRVWCRESGAKYSWYQERPASALIVSDLTHDVLFHYDGTLASPVSTTDWNGDWEIECDRGALQIRDSRLFFCRKERTEEIALPADTEDSRVEMLQEACRALREGRKAETDYLDNMKSFAWMRGAIRASGKRDWVTMENQDTENF